MSVGMKRFILITGLACILKTSLVFTPGSAHAQARTDLTPQHVAVAADNGSYFFNAGWWGWGVCLSHSTLVGLAGDSPTAVRAFFYYLATGAPVAGWQIGLAGAAFEVYVRSLQYYDRGSGVCLAWPFYMPSNIPIVWSR